MAYQNCNARSALSKLQYQNCITRTALPKLHYKNCCTLMPASSLPPLCSARFDQTLPGIHDDCELHLVFVVWLPAIGGSCAWDLHGRSDTATGLLDQTLPQALLNHTLPQALLDCTVDQTLLDCTVDQTLPQALLDHTLPQALLDCTVDRTLPQAQALVIVSLLSVYEVSGTGSVSVAVC
jgi:hypothetical protein